MSFSARANFSLSRVSRCAITSVIMSRTRDDLSFAPFLFFLDRRRIFTKCVLMIPCAFTHKTTYPPYARARARARKHSALAVYSRQRSRESRRSRGDSRRSSDRSDGAYSPVRPSFRATLHSYVEIKNDFNSYRRSTADG